MCFKNVKSEQAQMSYVTTPELIVSDTQDNCLEFYYHLDGIDSGAFVIIANALDTPFSEIPQDRFRIFKCACLIFMSI